MQSAWRATRRLASDGRLFSSAPFTKTPDVGIFVDAENMSHFLKNKGAERLIDTASERGGPAHEDDDDDDDDDDVVGR